MSTPEPGRVLLPPDSVARHIALRARMQEAARCRDAAVRARRTYPGLLGEFVHRELTAYADLGFFSDGLVSRLVDALLVTDPGPQDQ